MSVTGDPIKLNELKDNPNMDFVSLYENFMNTNIDDESIIKDIFTQCQYYWPENFEKSFANKPNTSNTSFFCINSRSLLSNWDDFCNLLCECTNQNFQFDIIGITELFSSCNHVKLCLNGYHPLEKKTRGPDDDGHGGVGLFIKDTQKFDPRPDLTVFIPHIFESLFVEIKTNPKSPIVVGVIYRPNTIPRADLDVFVETLYSINSILEQEKKTVLLMGDFNIDLLKFSSHPKTNDFIDNMFTQGFLPLISKPTRVTTTSATLIDHIYLNTSKAMNHTSGVLFCDVADHFGVFTILEEANKTLSRPFIEIRQTKADNMLQLNNLLEKTDFSMVFLEECPDKAYDIFIDLYISALNKACPKKSIQMSTKFVKREPWVSSAIIASSTKKKTLFSKKLNHPTEHNIQNYKDYCKTFNSIRRIAKRNYYADNLRKYKHNMKMTWRLLRSIINKQNNKTSVPDIFIINGSEVSDPNTISNEFNNYFASIGQNISDKVPKVSKNYKNYLRGNHDVNMYMTPTDPVDLIKVSKMLKPKHSKGFDEISPFIMKQTIEHTAVPLSHIFNQSLSTGIVPSKFKLSKITPIFKNGNPQLFNNYRPISVLPAFSKLLEKIVSLRLVNFLTAQNILYEHQYGFRKRHSTIHPIIHLLNDISSAQDDVPNNKTLAIYLDLSKAFDTISHSTLLNKLNHYGIRGVSHTWFSNYLSERNQYIEINNAKSSVSATTCGVPQGSILGPILFLIYINDIVNSCSIKLLSFADDTTIYASNPCLDSLFTTANTELTKLFTWLCANKLSLNIKKTKYSIFSNVQSINTSKHTILLNDISISRTSGDKFLGVTIDEKLTWSLHISKISSKIASSIFVMNRAKHFLSIDSLKMIYFSLIHSHMIYGIEAWGNSKALDKIFKLQKRAIRVMYRKPYRSHTDPLFINSSILKIKDIQILHASLFVHDFVHKRLPQSFSHTFNVDNNTARRPLNIYRERPRSVFSSNLPRHKFASLWNDLNLTTQSIKSRNMFKNTLKKSMIRKYNDNPSCSYERCPDCH